MWTRFMDMHSGGDTKVEPYDFIYVNLPEEEAIEWFERTYGRDPNNVTCDCCGEDYAIYSYETIEEATAYDRGCEYGEEGWLEQPRYYKWDKSYAKLLTVEEYFAHPDVLRVVI